MLNDTEIYSIKSGISSRKNLRTKENMNNVLELLGQMMSSKTTGENEESDEIGEVMHSMVRSVKRRMSSVGSIASTTRQSRKEALYNLYSSEKTERPHLSSDKRRHTCTSAGLNSSVKEFLFQREKTKRSDTGSVLDLAKEKLLPRSKPLSDVVANKVAARKKEMKTLTRAQTVAFMKIKYNL